MAILGKRKITCKRATSGGYLDGVWSATEETFFVFGSVQSVDAEMLEILDFGGGNKGAKLALICDLRQPGLRISEEGTNKASDLVVIEDVAFFVETKAVWSRHKLNHIVYGLRACNG